MIISASRRTDIPSYYSEWFINRLKEGYVLIQNPRNINRYSKASLTRESVDCIVFWTKNPIPMMDKLDIIDSMGYSYYFQFTLTPYGRDVESGLPNKKRLIQVFKQLSNKLGDNRVIWRYDPIIIGQNLSIDYHIKAFEYMARELKGYTNRCVISFVDSYKSGSQQYDMSIENIKLVAKAFSDIAKDNSMVLMTCSEEYALEEYGIGHGACIDKGIIEDVLGVGIKTNKDRNQRPACKCIESIDVGTYNCCMNGCNYCYAVTSSGSAYKNMMSHNPKSPVLIGVENRDAIITERDSKSIIIDQLSLF